MSSPTFTHPSYRHLFIGMDIQVPLLKGDKRPYINLDNAASTPPLLAVQQAINEFARYYSSVHRGTGFKSQLSTHVYEEARCIVLNFVRANPDEHTCAFVKNTTEAINKLSRRFPFTSERDVVLTTGMEHHSNDLPWRAATKTVHIKLTPDGLLDEADFELQLSRYASRLALVAITGASNVSGYITPIHRLAEQTHAAGGLIFVDCAQLAPHRQVNMRPLSDPEHLDFIAISAHKMYAPYGTGALIGRIDILAQGDPDMRGGGTVEIVTLDDVVWAAPPDRDEAGSPNTIGAIALAAAIRQLEQIGMPAVAEHEASLTAHALEKLSKLPGIQIYGDTNPANAASRLGVIPLQLSTMPHFLASAILGYEFGIGVRSGCFCAHPYILHLLGITPQESSAVRASMLAGDKSNMPGLIRASFGLYNTLAEVDYFVDALAHMIRGEYTGQYHQDIATGEYFPIQWQPDFNQYFRLA